MNRLRIATQLPPRFTDALAQRMPDVEWVDIPRGADFRLDPDIEILLPGPFAAAGGTPPAIPPPGWPFGLRWVQLISAGLDFYPPWLFAVEQVTSARGASAPALAEYALAAVFAAAKQLPESWIHSAEEWVHRPVGDVAGSTLTIFGFGAIAEALAPRAQAMGMKVIATRRSDAPFPISGVERAADLPELIARADHLVLAAPSTPETTGIINGDTLSHARPGLHLINLARGNLIDDAALLAALDNGQVARATLDVTHPEPLPAGHPFYTHPRVLLSPHTNTLTPNTIAATADQVADNLMRFLRGEPLQNRVGG